MSAGPTFDGPNLLIEWSSPWREFRSAIGPALARSPRQLAGEAHTGLFPYRGILVAWVFEAVLLVAAVVIPVELAKMRPYVPAAPPKYEVIYYSGYELPRTEDSGGSSAGRAGQSGGREARHRTQIIRVARGSTLQERIVDAPDLKLPRINTSVANLLAYKPVPGPPPAEGLKNSRSLPSMQQSAVVPPSPEVQMEARLKMPVFSQPVVAPAASLPDHDLTSQPIPGMNQVQVVPPPVSAPEQLTNRKARLTLPAAEPVAPPPTLSAHAIEMRGPRFGNDAMHTEIVPPPVRVTSDPSTRALPKFGAASVVPPPVAVEAISGRAQKTASLGRQVSVVPPPVSLSAISGRSQKITSAAVVPPAPKLAANVNGSGRGNRGMGLGQPMAEGPVAASPQNAGSTKGMGVVISSKPGTSVAVPGHHDEGTLAMSPTGGDTPGIGGSGGEAGINHGRGPGSGFSGNESGMAKIGGGHGSDPNARAGISPYPGTGGAGSGTDHKPAMPGVSVQGGSNIVTLPSFGDDPSAPGQPGHSSASANREGPGITVVATSRSGGAFNYYGVLKGDRVYTIYIDTSLGTVVMQFADPLSATHAYAQALKAPEPLRSELPTGLPHARLVISCVLDRTGTLRNPHVLETSSALMTSKVIAALRSWKFKPVARGAQPTEVNAILGFNIDTSDQF